MTIHQLPTTPELRLYTVLEAVEMLHMSRSVIFELLRDGRLRSVKEGGSRRIPGTAIAEYIATLEAEAEAEAA